MKESHMFFPPGQLTKMVSTKLCPPVLGQCAMAIVCNEPKPGDPSHKQFIQVSLSMVQPMTIEILFSFDWLLCLLRTSVN